MNVVRSIILFAILASLAGSSASELVEISYCHNTEGQVSKTTPRTHTLPLFDPSLGRLVKVDINLTQNATHFLGFTNLYEDAGRFISTESSFWVNLTMPDGTELKLEQTNETQNNYVGPYNKSIPEATPPHGFNYIFNDSVFHELSYDVSDLDELRNFTAQAPGEDRDFLVYASSSAMVNVTNFNAEYATFRLISAMCIKYTYDAEVLK